MKDRKVECRSPAAPRLRRASSVKVNCHRQCNGFGMYGNRLFMETADNYVVSLDAATGKERWHKQIADVKLGYFSTNAPLIVGNHVIVDTGGDNLHIQGFVKSLDPEN